MDKLLQKYKCAPSQAGKEWTQKLWKDEEKVIELIEQCQAAQRFGVKKGKGMVCVVLGACLSCAQQEAKKTPAPQLISNVEYSALESENGVLKSSLAFERETGKTLTTRVDKLVSENDKLVSESGKLVSENDKLVSENGKLVCENDKLVCENDTLASENGKLVNENGKLVNENSKLVSESTKLVRENNRRANENNRLVSENNYLKQLLERVNRLLDKMQPSAPVKQVRRLMRGANSEVWDGDLWFDSDDDEVEGASDSEPQLTAVDDDDEIHTTVRTIPWSPAELIKIQEKFSRQPGESEVEYVCRVSLEGGDRIMLSEEEAGGFWGLGVFLTTTPGEHNYSSTARAAYWAGGIDPQDRGEPQEIKVTGYSDLAAAIQKAACIQVIYERDELRKSPMLAPIDPARLTPLIHGLPDCLKIFVANTQDRIQDARRDISRDRRRGQRAPIPTWSEFVQDINKYGCRMGWVSLSSAKFPDQARRVRQVYTQNTRSNGRFEPYKERTELWRKALDLGIPWQILHGVSTGDLRTLIQFLDKRNNPAGGKHLTGKPPTYKGNTLSAPGSIDETEPQQKNFHPPGRAVRHPARRVLAIQWLSDEYSDPTIAILGKSWEWTEQHTSALDLLIEELRLFQQLGPIHLTDPIHVEWGFSEHGSHCNLWQKGPEGPERPLEFSSHSFSDTKRRYSDLEKGLLSLDVIIWGPFRLLDIVKKGTIPPADIAQKPTVRKWHAYLEGINEIMPITEGNVKISKLQKDIDSTLLFQSPPNKPSLIREAPPLKEGSDLTGVWFTDASSHRENSKWKYKAVAVEVATGEKLIETGEGSAQVGELRAILLAAQHGASHIYTDSCAVFKGATEWIGHWAVSDWQVNRVPVWQTDRWKQLLETGEQWTLHIGWVKGHDQSNSIAAQFNQQMDSLTRLRQIDVANDNQEWERLLEWLHVKRCHTGRADLYREGIARGWPVSVKLCEQVVTACSQCRLRLNKDHLSKAPPLHIRDRKTLWHSWQIDYIGPLRPSGGNKYVLVGVEIISGLTMAAAFSSTTGENTMKGLKGWFSTLPLPEEIQSDNGSHFTAVVVQNWAKEEGIRWVFHTPYYPQANGIVECTNGLVKHFANTHEPGWHLRLYDAIYQLNNRWSGDGCPKVKAFCVLTNTITQRVPPKPGEYSTGFYTGQPVLVKMPQIGIVPMVLTTPKNPYAWEAKDCSGKVHRISTQWISPSV
ncbi:hypothetical protein QYF61_011389 [Mycteria americana]|uniref:Uncharacterized protein n=1 Tax=Mycteria americana TaxID=33587 RepID=A0AAN7N8A2_MYCAM|nr:hypothetical protein QYF61_011389 [Mycteria americana]